MNKLSRVALYCYPHWWREDRGEEVLGLLQDTADANGRRHPSTADVLNLAAHGLRVRAGSSPVRTNQKVRNRIAVIALVLLAANSITLLIFGEWAPWDPGTSFEPSPVANLTTGSIVYLAVVAAAVAVLLGRLTTSRCLAAFAGFTALAIQWPPLEQFALSHGIARPPSWLLCFLAVVCFLAAAGAPVPPRRSRRLFGVLTAAATIVAIVVTATSLGSNHWFFYRMWDSVETRLHLGILLGVALAVIAVVLLAGKRRLWAAAFAANALPWLLLFYVQPMPAFREVAPLDAVLVLAVVALAAVTALVLLHATRGDSAQPELVGEE